MKQDRNQGTEGLQINFQLASVTPSTTNCQNKFQNNERVQYTVQKMRDKNHPNKSEKCVETVTNLWVWPIDASEPRARRILFSGSRGLVCLVPLYCPQFSTITFQTIILTMIIIIIFCRLTMVSRGGLIMCLRCSVSRVSRSTAGIAPVLHTQSPLASLFLKST